MITGIIGTFEVNLRVFSIHFCIAVNCCSCSLLNILTLSFNCVLRDDVILNITYYLLLLHCLLSLKILLSEYRIYLRINEKLQHLRDENRSRYENSVPYRVYPYRRNLRNNHFTLHNTIFQYS